MSKLFDEEYEPYDEEYDWTEDEYYEDMEEYFYGDRDEEADWDFADDYIESLDGEHEEEWP